MQCKKCGCEFDRKVNKDRNQPSWCSRKCYDEDHFIWSRATDEEKIDRYREAYDKLVVRKEGCWDWKGYQANTGYGEIATSKNGLEKNAHRISWIIHNGMIPEGKWILHKCDNPICSNPDHLFIGTTQENTEDRHKKGRTLKGSEVTTAVLSEDQVVNIKKYLTEGKSCLMICRDLKISHDCVKKINKNQTWKHIPWPTEKIGNGRKGPNKLNEEQVKEIKKLLKLGASCVRLGKDYKVHFKTIEAIKVGKNWKYVEG